MFFDTRYGKGKGHSVSKLNKSGKFLIDFLSKFSLFQIIFFDKNLKLGWYKKYIQNIEIIYILFIFKKKIT